MVEKKKLRHNRRFNHEAAILIENPPDGIYHHGKMVNYSRAGMYFESNVAHQPGSTIIFGIENSPYSACSGVYRAQVKWCKKLPDDVSIFYYGVGVEYIRPDGPAAHTGQRATVPPRSGPHSGNKSRKDQRMLRGAPGSQRSGIHSTPVKKVAKKANQREQRKHPRKSYPKTIVYGSHHRFHKGVIKDISRGGIFIETNDVFHIGENLILALPYANHAKGLKVKGEVVRIGRHGLAVKFNSIIKN